MVNTVGQYKAGKAGAMLYKIVAREEWLAAVATGLYLGSSDDVRDGFIHLSASHQVRGTAEKYFQGQTDLLLVSVDGARLGEALKWEPSRGGDLFPHVYGPLPTSAAVSYVDLPLNAEGLPILPVDLGG